jgi:hypothetical protein
LNSSQRACQPKFIAAGQAGELETVEEKLDQAAARLWGLSETELEDIRQSLEELQ